MDDFSWKTNGPWEYLVQSLFGTFLEHESILDDHGSSNWELVSVVSNGDDSVTAYFKRPKISLERQTPNG